MLLCNVCNEEKYANHSATAPHAGNPPSECIGYVPGNPCQACGQDCELHGVEIPHTFPEYECSACVPPAVVKEGTASLEPGGGGYGGGGATGGW